MTRRYSRGRRRPVSQGRGPLLQLGLFVLGLVLLLSFHDDIARGTAGCFGNLAVSSDEGDGRAADAPASAAPDPAAPSVAPGPAAVPVTVRVLRDERPASSPDGAGPASSGPATPAASDAEQREDAGQRATPDDGP